MDPLLTAMNRARVSLGPQHFVLAVANGARRIFVSVCKMEGAPRERRRSCLLAQYSLIMSSFRLFFQNVGLGLRRVSSSILSHMLTQRTIVIGISTFVVKNV